MTRGTRRAFAVGLVGLVVLAPLLVMSLKSWEWWRYPLAVVGLGYLLPVLWALAGRELIAAVQKRCFSANLVIRALVTVILVVAWVVLSSFVVMPSVEDALERLSGFLRAEVFVGLALTGLLGAALPHLGSLKNRDKGGDHRSRPGEE